MPHVPLRDPADALIAVALVPECLPGWPMWSIRSHSSKSSLRRFLVEVDHPNIVKIHDFVQHPDPKSGQMAGYTVMEYVGGQSLKELARANTGPGGRRMPLPLPQVLAYGLEVLPALGYLHAQGLLFCDFKPDNVIQAEEQIKLIDLGAVRHIDDDDSVMFGTPGYQAPELATAGASIGSDLYTVGRTLAVLSFDFHGFSSRYADRLPAPGEVELLDREESYYRFLCRATHPDVRQRFRSAAEMADQLLGVLREVLAAEDGVPRAGTSSLFTQERAAFGATGAELTGHEVATALPRPGRRPVRSGGRVSGHSQQRDSGGTEGRTRAEHRGEASAGQGIDRRGRP